jgi:tetratricopeptide (TPR) repeat protein
MKKNTLLCLFSFLLCYELSAQTRADKLLKKLNAGKNESSILKQVSAAKDVKIDVWEKFKLEDAFLTMLFTEWKVNQGFNPAQKKWVEDILSLKFETALSEIKTVHESVHPSVAEVMEMSSLYLMYRLDLAQTFFDKWLPIAESEMKSRSKLYITLDQVIGRNAPAWFAAQAITLSPEDRKRVRALDGSKSTFTSTAKLWTMLRSGAKGLAYLKTLPAGHPFIIPLARTVILGLARSGKASDAGSLMKSVLEPAVLATDDPRELSRYYLLLARILYQVKAYDTAIEFYSRIPNSVPEFLQARMEMSWALIRMGDMERLRGEIASFDTGLFESAFVPEIYLVRSISNLKYCRYTEIGKDFESFIRSNKNWAKKIQRAINKNEFVEKDTYDYYIDQRNLALKNRQEEKAYINKMNKDGSLGHLASSWLVNLEDKISTTKVQRDREYKRYWKNRELVLDRTILKMRFVKVETMSQVRLANISLSKLATVGGDKVTSRLAAREKSDELRFPYDGVIWKDELFRLRAKTDDYCVRKKK